MSVAVSDLTSFEALREIGDYDKLATSLPDQWQALPPFQESALRLRLLVAETKGHFRQVDEMRALLAPYLESVQLVPFGFVARVLVAASHYHYLNANPEDSLHAATLARKIAAAREEDFVLGEAVQKEGQALCLFNRTDEAFEKFNEAISIYASQTRAYRVGIAQLCLGTMLNRWCRFEDALTALERSLKTLLRCHDEHSIAVTRLQLAQALNALGKHDLAFSYLQLACSHFKKANLEDYWRQSLNATAETCVWIKLYEKAERCISQLGEDAETLEIRARSFLARKIWDQAEGTLMAAYELAEGHDNPAYLAKTLRTLARYHLQQGREAEAESALRHSLSLLQTPETAHLEIEVKALLIQAIHSHSPSEACWMMSEVEAALGNRPLPQLRREVRAARKKIDSLEQEHFFILSDAEIPRLAVAKNGLLKWLWGRALHKAKGNAREAAKILGVTPAYIRRLTKMIPRDLLKTSRKKYKRKQT